MSEKYEFIDAQYAGPYWDEECSDDHPDVRMAGNAEIQLLRLAVPTGKRDSEAQGIAENQD